ncbi:hypothetical protein TeGR_g5107 [Tetraparma gracilis]|uniref:Leucine-rich repeat-containing protein n=1 Tax=Tetraparma gracilis TaxID=2962635 RepID=A0ABQ6MGU5_9STRA|nr:hypothetical protein TeGR_g5107 [Tetraparma gracilis]
MEEYDELSAGPNEHGALDLSHSAWAELPDQLFAFSHRLLSLNLAHNKLVEVEADFGKLDLLSDLNLEGNLITQIHPNIGKCIRLKTLNLNSNRIGSIPDEIGNCTLLEEFRCQNNFIETLPPTVGNIIALRIIEMQNNKLTFLPPELGHIPTIQEIHCEGNPGLVMVPDDMRASSDMVIWALRLHRTHQEKVDAKVVMYDQLEAKTRHSEEERLRLKDDRDEVEEEVKQLEEMRPVGYINTKKKVKQLVHRAKSACVIS